MGREEGIPVVPPTLTIHHLKSRWSTLCRLTSASLITLGLRITLLAGQDGILPYVHMNGSRGNFHRVRTNATFSGCVASLWRLPPAYFPLSTPLMFVIISKSMDMSRPGLPLYWFTLLQTSSRTRRAVRLRTAQAYCMAWESSKSLAPEYVRCSRSGWRPWFGRG
jgi:hypothetical protein